MANFPPTLNSAQIGNGGGCEERLCNAVAAKQGKSAACCPFPCAVSVRSISGNLIDASMADVSLVDASLVDVPLNDPNSAAA